MINLENGGERMDINFHSMNYESFDMYQKSHFKRYEFVKKIINKQDIVADLACGSGYGTMMMSELCDNILGVDICENTINEITNRYSSYKNVIFEQKDLLDLKINKEFDKIISFETIEHFVESDITKIFEIFNKGLKDSGRLIFSTPYDQEQSINSMQFHKTFYIKEEKIINLMSPYFEVEKFYYQNYETHEISEDISPKHFMICVAKKIEDGKN